MLTSKDAQNSIKILEDIEEYIIDEYDRDRVRYDSALSIVPDLSIAVTFLEKEIPQKIIHEIADAKDPEYGEYWVCPNCRKIIVFAIEKNEEYSYCPKCGQRLEWKNDKTNNEKTT